MPELFSLSKCYLAFRKLPPVDIIFGGGRYGLKAAEYLLSKNRDFIVIDPDRECLVMEKLRLPKFDRTKGGAFIQGSIKELVDVLSEFEVEHVFPTAPVHLAAMFLKENLNLEVWNEGINFALSGIPAKIILSAGKGSVVVSYNRDYECLENCSAPNVCPVTKLRKPAPMYDMLRFAAPDGYIIESRYLKPGLGAIKGEDLKNLVKWAEKINEMIVGTACRCHGVLSSFRRV